MTKERDNIPQGLQNPHQVYAEPITIQPVGNKGTRRLHKLLKGKKIFTVCFQLLKPIFKLIISVSSNVLFQTIIYLSF